MYKLPIGMKFEHRRSAIGEFWCYITALPTYHATYLVFPMTFLHTVASSLSGLYNIQDGQSGSGQ
ncbi:hypothetical protein PgNI_11367 [Pyricularia grisea]|uniref:Uncharacterized protein n=1 Tax=Pyricularia grisea TaxID=148305 RepID=A0A6P8APU3_PYRGI|nr:hypothetical protein PgNI_11367 [Pyricularia grisea]TLD04046.1 hypothetical protein PgNI_11367 [Pyricularia grisea]